MVRPGDFAQFPLIRLVEHPGEWSIIFDLSGARRLGIDTFALRSLEGNGYDWSAAAQARMTDDLPQALMELDFDAEAGMVSIVSSDLHALFAAATALHLLQHDTVALSEALDRAAELDLLE
ncbi:MAG TPA: Imm51 family immunity protein [Kribbellaceae bacterium]|nr:Imm51 family immunity protein [Kribbellaceae bacterium]